MSEPALQRPEGFEAPVHLSLVEPILVAGLPRTVAFLYWTLIAAFVVGLHQLWILPLGLLGHFGLVRLTRFDPHFLEVIRCALKHQKDKLP